MSTEKDWFVKEYAQDIHNYLRAKERKRFLYLEKSPQLSMRKSLVEWMGIVCEKMDFCTTVQHLAVYLLDIFLDNHTVSGNHLQLATVGCLIVAVKLEENDSLPKNSDFNALIGNKYILKEFVQMELTVLNFFKWDILFPTAAHFAEYYGIYSVSPTDNYEGGPLLNMEHVKLYVQKYIEYFLEVTLQDTVFHKFYPSLVAASCILSTRMCLVLTPPWPVSLQDITYYKYAQLKPCVEILLRALDVDVLTNKAQQIKNSSYSSKSSSSLSENSECMLLS